MKLFRLCAVALGLLALEGGTASAQTSPAEIAKMQAAYDVAVAAANARIAATPPGQQLTLAMDECAKAVAAHEAMPARAWCAGASAAAVSVIDRWGGPRVSPELDTIRRALWMDAVDGLKAQKNPWYGSPRVETIDTFDDPRGSAYILFAVINRGERTLPGFRFEGMARGLGAPLQPKETYGSLRRRAFDRLDEMAKAQAEPSPAVLWGYAAIGLTAMLGDRKDDMKVEAAVTAARLTGKADTARGFTGEDAALFPALRLAEGWSLFLAQNYVGAAEILQSGAATCPARIWDDAVLCKQLDNALARAVAEAAKTKPPPAPGG